MLVRFCSRIVAAAGVLAASGLLAAALVRMAPGFGMDDRLLDARWSAGSLEAIQQQNRQGSDILHFYWQYLSRLSAGDLGTSASLGRPVRELLGERMAVTFRSGTAGLALAWSLSLLLVAVLELARKPCGELAASAVTSVLLCLPAAVLALVAAYIGATPGMAIGAILFPRIFRYARNLARQACGAPHVLAARALGMRPVRILGYHVMAPVMPELLALAGVSVSMAVGAAIPVEALCDSPGVGQLVWQAALARDIPVLVNVTLLITALTASANLLAEWHKP